MNTGNLHAALRRLGFKYVFDTNFSADVTIMEEGTEFIKRFTQGGNLPLLTSCCPAWTDWMEKYAPDFTENFSSATSPQQMLSALYTDHLGDTAANSGEKAARGAVLVSPCLSHGEREIMRRTHATGGRVILLRNKGFSRYEKPSGALFDACAQGKLLLLAPPPGTTSPAKSLPPANAPSSSTTSPAFSPFPARR